MLQRSKSLCWAAAILVLVFFVRLSAHAQVPKTDGEISQALTEADSVLTITKSVDEVHLNFTVTNKGGKFIKGLKAEDFDLLDNLRPPERVIRFRENTESPMRVILLFDVSTSIRYRFDFEQKAANHFIKHVLRPGIDEAAIIAFGSDVQEVQPMTGDINKLAAAVSKLRADGDTTLYDAVIRASADMRSMPSSDFRKVVIIRSDGGDTTSHSTSKDCLEAAVSSDALILVVDASFPSQNNLPEQKYLRKLAEISGGRVLPARQDSELKGAFATIGKILHSQYALSYRPALFQRNGSYRPIQLTTQKQGLVIHSRTGYYAAPN